MTTAVKVYLLFATGSVAVVAVVALAARVVAAIAEARAFGRIRNEYDKLCRRDAERGLGSKESSAP